jgi:peptide chain release factor subunit 1
MGKSRCHPLHSSERCWRFVVSVGAVIFYPTNIFAEEIIVHHNKELPKDREKFTDKSTGLEMEQAAEPVPLLEWFAEKYKDFGANLEFVTNRSQEGAQFVKGFGGIGGLLRYKVDMANLSSVDEEEDEFYSDEEGV